jgi:hypothetical protein
LPAGDDLAIVLFLMTLVFGFGLEAMKAEAVARKVVFSVLTAACLLTGGFWLQIKEVWPPFTKTTISVGTNPVAWFVVLMFILAVFAFHRPTNRNWGVTSGPEPDPVPLSQRIFLDVSLTYLTGLYKDRTSLQADALAAAYLTKWMSVTGKVAEMTKKFDGGLIVLIRSDDEKIVSASFLEKDKEKITHIAHGTAVTVQGELERINSYSVNLRNCEIV